nr:glycosyltransferase family 39 protein [Kineococcus siccus]
MLRGLRVTDAGLGLWYAAVHPWVQLSTSTLWLRLPGAAATVATAALTALVARRLAGPGAGAVAGVLAVLTPVVVTHSQEARPYPVITACVAATAYGLLRDRAEPRRRWLLLWAGAGTAAAGLHVLTGAPVVAALLAVALVAPGRCRRRRVVGGGLPAAAVTLGMVVAGLSQAPGRIGPDFPLLERTAGLWTSYAGSAPALVGLLGLAVAGAAALRHDPPALALVLAGVLAPVAGVVGAAAAGQLFEARYTTAAAPAGLAAAGAVVALTVAGQVPHLVTERERPWVGDDVRCATGALAAGARPGDALVALGNTTRPMLRASLPRGVPADDVLLAVDPARSVSIGGDELPEADRTPALAGAERVWLVGVRLHDPWPVAFPASLRAVQAGRAQTSGRDCGDLRVELWTAPGPARTPAG